MTKHPSYRARDQPESGSASQHRKDKIMHKFEKRDAKSRTLVILAVVGLAAALMLGIFTAVRMLRKPPASKDDPKTGIVYDDSAVEGGWDNLRPEEIAEKLNEKVAEGMINISMNTAPYFENGTAEIAKMADWDTVKSNVFAKAAIRFVQSLPETRLLKSTVVPFEMERLDLI